MCKVFAIAGVKPEHQKTVKQIMYEASFLLSKAPDKDGLGYATIDKNGTIFAEKWTDPSDAFYNPKEQTLVGEKFLKDNFDQLIKDHIDLTPKKIEHSTFGKTTPDFVAMIMHSRNRTIGLTTLENTHPFVLEKTRNNPAVAMIHNGTITNHEELTKKTSTCDSEVILHEYVKNKVWNYPEAIKETTEALYGEYACLFLTTAWEGNLANPVLDIFKSGKPLHVAYIKELGVPVFCTRSDIITEVVASVGLTVSKVFELRDEKYIRIDALTGGSSGWLVDFKANPIKKYVPSEGTKSTTNQSYSTGSSNKSLSLVKKQFEENNIDIFEEEYATVDLSPEDCMYLDELKEQGGNARAIALIERALGR